MKFKALFVKELFQAKLRQIPQLRPYSLSEIVFDFVPNDIVGFLCYLFSILDLLFDALSDVKSKKCKCFP